MKVTVRLWALGLLAAGAIGAPIACQSYVEEPASESLGEHLNVDAQVPVPSAQRLDSGVWLFVHPTRPTSTSLVPEAGTIVWVEAGAAGTPKPNVTAYDAATGDASNDH